jgi:type II secretory pathway component PulF
LPTFDYTALKSGQSEQIKGRIDADTERDARRKIRQKGETAVTIKEVKVGGRSGIPFENLFKPNHSKSVFIFTTQLQYLIRSGITLTDALKVLADQSDNKDFSNILKLLYSSVVEKGKSFADALKDFPHCFSHLYISMVNAGESTGTLPEVLLRLAHYAKKKEEVEGKVRSALTYPVIMLVVGLGVVVFLLSYLVPKIEPILTKKDGGLPEATELLLTISATFSNYWWAFLMGFIAVTSAYKMILSTKKGRRFFDGFFLRVPIVGDLNRKAAVSRFCVTLSSLLKSGVKIEKAMKIVEEVVGNAVVAETVQIISERIREGESIAGPLERSNLFPKVVTYMISVGEKAGSEELQEMLDSISESYDMELEQSATRLTDLLTPILLLFMAGLVVFILLAVLLPIMNLSTVR